MPSRQLSTPGIGASFARPWLKWTAALLACLGILAAAGYVTRCILLLNVARIVLTHDSALVAQERADAVAIVFANPPPAWITPMKNQMNGIWEPIKANCVNYYMFAKPQTWFRTYSERSNPISPYYQAWPRRIIVSVKPVPAASTLMRTSPGPGSGIAESTSTCMASDRQIAKCARVAKAFRQDRHRAIARRAVCQSSAGTVGRRLAADELQRFPDYPGTLTSAYGLTLLAAARCSLGAVQAGTRR